MRVQISSRMTSSQTFAAMIRALSERAAVVVANESNSLASLFPEEEAVVRCAVGKRRREFAAGRHCARRALAHFGVKPGPIGVDASRAPTWPCGFVGSITHSEGFTAAVVAQRADLRGIGVDAESSAPLGAELISAILTPAEMAWLDDAAVPGTADWGKVVFSAKESVHKCVHPLSGVMLDFLDVELTIDPLDGIFRARGRNPDMAARQLHEIEGRFAITQEFVFTAAVVRANC